MRKVLIFFTAIVSNIHIFAQVSVKDSSVFVPMFYATYAYQFVSGDIAKRFGSNSAVGGGFQIKTKKNWLFGAEYNYLFGANIKNESSILSNISTHDGFIIGANGEYADVFFHESGYRLGLKAGKIFNWFGPNPNCGMLFSIEPGFLQHKIKITNNHNTAPQLKGDYKKGYDEMCNGFSLSEFIGYMHIGNKRLVSFYAGFEFTQAFTKCRRDFNFNTRSADKSQKYDFFYSVRVGWLIPLFKRAPSGYYY